jgi:hypothetical protein
VLVTWFTVLLSVYTMLGTSHLIEGLKISCFLATVSMSVFLVSGWIITVLLGVIGIECAQCALEEEIQEGKCGQPCWQQKMLILPPFPPKGYFVTIGC